MTAPNTMTTDTQTKNSLIKQFNRGLLLYHEVELHLGEDTIPTIGTYREYLAKYPGGKEQRLKDLTDHLERTQGVPPNLSLIRELRSIAHNW